MHHNEVDHIGNVTFQKKYWISGVELIKYYQTLYAEQGRVLDGPTPLIIKQDFDEPREFDIEKDTIACIISAVRTHSAGGCVVQLHAFETQTDKVAELMKKKDKNFRVLLIEMPDE